MVDQSHPVIIPERARTIFQANKNVLVIEDDKIMGQMVAEILEDVGFEVVTATNSRIAFEKLARHSVDFIVLDILLPEIDGFELYTELQANPATRDIPVMVITAWSSDVNRRRAAELGIQHFLAKPFTEDELIYTIMTLLIDSSR